jgi:signal transduction histidine kinase
VRENIVRQRNLERNGELNLEILDNGLGFDDATSSIGGL